MPFNEKQFLKDLATFISFKTIVNKNPSEFKKARKWIKSYFDKSKTEFLEFKHNGYDTLLIKPKDSKKPNILGDGHIEVVPADDAHFKLTKQGTHYHGRGVGDMKTQCLMMMYVLRELISQNNHNDFWILFSEDEEAGSKCGVAITVKGLKKKGLLPKVVFAPDGGPNFSYVEKEKGTMAFTALVKGKGAHASRPFLGNNPLNKVYAFYNELQKKFPNPKNEADWIPSLSMTTIQGGTGFNKIPERCEAQFDLRFTEKYKAEKVAKEIEKVAKKYKIKIEFHMKDAATYYPKTAPIAKKYLKILKEVSGKKPKIIHSNGASNGRIYVMADPKIHVLMSDPNVINSHAANECLIETSLKPFYDLVYRTTQLKVK